MNDILKQDQVLRRAVSVFALALIGWFVVAHTSLIAQWTLNGAPASLSQGHAFCSSETSQLLDAAGNTTNATTCSSINGWWDFASFLEVIMLVAFLLAAYRVYRHYYPRAQQG